MKKIFHLCFTGGPCGGKSTAITKVFAELTKRGYTVLVVPESATEIIVNGITADIIGNKKFQEFLFEKQIKKEKLYHKVTKCIQNDKIVIIYDRGLMDSKCYMSDEEFKNLLKVYKTNEMEIKSRYDAIFHLVTAANGASNYYTTANNSARKEGVEEAIALDNRCIEVWTGHPHFRVIDNSTDFENKIKRLLKEIYSVIGDPVPIEIERKFLIKKESINYISKFCSATVCDITQFYLKKQNGFERRIRSFGIDGNYSYFYTKKKKNKDEGRIEIERKISQKEYLKYLAEEVDTSISCIKKKRVCFVYKSEYIEIDLFEFSDDKAIMEIELTSMSQKIELPEFIQIIKEVTDDDTYSNYNLAKTKKLD